jgi:hypothetical protein
MLVEFAVIKYFSNLGVLVKRVLTGCATRLCFSLFGAFCLSPWQTIYRSFMFKFFNAIATLLFFTMAAIQLNDPDPIYWVVVYSTAALLSGGLCIGSRLETISKVTMGMVLAGLLISGPGVIEYFTAEDYASIYGGMSAEKPYVESAREFGGLLIVAIYLVLFASKIGNTKKA